MTRLSTAIAVACLFALFADDSHARQEGWPEWLQKDMQREKKKLKFRDKLTEGEEFLFRMPGKASDPASFDGGWYASGDIGGESPLECYAFEEGTDIATAVMTLTNVNIGNMAETHGKVENSRTLFGVDAGNIEGAPFIALNMFYTIGEAPDALAGLSKVRLATKGDNAFACLHNEIGYQDTFARAFEEFVKAAKLKPLNPEPHYSEIVLQNLNGMNVGYTHVTMARDEDGDVLTITTNSMVFPISLSDISTSDSTDVTWSTPDGKVILSNSATADNGELTTNLRLEQDEEGNWISYGTFEGKEIEQLLGPDITPNSELGVLMRTKAMFDSEDSEASFPVWVPSVAPTEFIDAKIVETETPDDVDGRTATFSVGPLIVDGIFDDFGGAREVNMQIGPVQVDMKRIYRDGTPW